MTKEQKDNLFVLIKSLSKSEKRQFKLYVGRLGVNSDSKFLNLFNFLDKIGQLDLVIKLSYVIFLSLIGSMMFSESLRLILRKRKGKISRGKLHQHNWLHGLPFKTRFRKSKLQI